MAELDFTALNKLAYRGFETVEEREQKDKLIAQGFTIVEDAENPFLLASEKASEPLSASTLIRTSSMTKQALERKLEPFTGNDKSRNYRAMYRAACNFHERNNPPTVDSEYWKSHIPGTDETPQAELDYWAKAVKDIGVTAGGFNNDPFLQGLLSAIFEELEREYQQGQRDAMKGIEK